MAIKVSNTTVIDNDRNLENIEDGSFSGNVGIGTSSPSEQLEVYGASPNILINNTAETTSGIKFVDAQAPSEQNAAVEFNSVGNNSLNFSVNSAERMRINSLGNVGIGTSIPSATLDVNGDFTAESLSTAGDGVEFRRGDGNLFGVRLKTSDATQAFVYLAESHLFTDQSETTEFLRIDSSGNVGIGTSSPSEKLSVEHAGNVAIEVKSTGTGDADALVIIDAADTGEATLVFRQDGANKAAIEWFSAGSPDLNFITETGTNGVFDFQPNRTLAMRIDESGNVKIYGNNGTSDTRQLTVESEGYAVVKVNGDLSNTSGEPGGAAVQLGVDGTGIDAVVSYVQSNNDSGYGTTYTGTVGNSMLVGSVSNAALFFGTDSTARLRVSAASLFPVTDNSFDLGTSGNRYDDIFATNGTIQTSDRNEKQDIEALSDAEQRVAVAAKGLLRKYRWKDAVAEKGDDARIHFGIIAQDLQDAFAAEGLDAGRYAMFTSDSFWEVDEQIPAQAEILDENGNVLAEAREAHTFKRVYNTADEAPEGATQKTRLGVRYSELLAFIIAAI